MYQEAFFDELRKTAGPFQALGRAAERNPLVLAPVAGGIYLLKYPLGSGLKYTGEKFYRAGDALMGGDGK
jgi:hypothetical protein